MSRVWLVIPYRAKRWLEVRRPRMGSVRLHPHDCPKRLVVDPLAVTIAPAAERSLITGCSSLHVIATERTGPDRSTQGSALAQPRQRADVPFVPVTGRREDPDRGSAPSASPRSGPTWSFGLFRPLPSVSGSARGTPSMPAPTRTGSHTAGEAGADLRYDRPEIEHEDGQGAQSAGPIKMGPMARCGSRDALRKIDPDRAAA
jgi:hypothetical protein